MNKLCFRLKQFIIVTVLFVSSFYAAIVNGGDIDTYIPVGAYKYAPLLKREQLFLWPDHPKPELLAALVEQESCVALRIEKKCWSPTIQLKTKREFAVGFSQITKAFNPDGSIRFDSLEGMRKAHMAELKELSWGNIAQRPDLQFRILVLMNRDNYNRLYDVPNQEARLAFTDAAYNGGLGGVFKEMRLCGLTKGCNPQLWFDNVEKTCGKSKKPLYGKRSACDINREHVTLVMLERSPKYQELMK